MAAELNIAELTHDPRTVAARLPAWRRGDPGEAIGDTLALSSRTTFQRAYIAWIWVSDAEGGTRLALPVPSADAERFSPRGSMAVITRCVLAVHDAGARAAELTWFDWDGMTGLSAPGTDATLVELALLEHHRPPGRVAVAAAPEGTSFDGPPLELGAPTTALPELGLATVAQTLRTHPLLVAAELAEQGWQLDEAEYPSDIVDLLRHRGYQGPERPPDAPSHGIADDPCPRRRHARRVLRRLLHARKVGRGYHTEFAHLARGVPPDDRADALRIGEALVRTGLLGEKPSVGQRHVYLRRDALPAIHALIERGQTDDPALAGEWTAPAP